MLSGSSRPPQRLPGQVAGPTYGAAAAAAAGPAARLSCRPPASSWRPLHRNQRSKLPQQGVTGAFSSSLRLQQLPVSPSASAAPPEVERQANDQPKGSGNPLAVLPSLSDAWKENNRKDMRTVFDFECWKQHRSSSRYLRHFSTLPGSAIVRGLVQPLMYVLVVAVAVTAYHLIVEAGHLPIWPALKLATNAPFGITSFALSLLLVFRTNSSYGRWDEARKMWGQIVNRSRDLIRQGLGYIPAWQVELQDALVRWTIAYSRSLMCHLREGEHLEAELKDTLPPVELQALLAAEHRPNYCCQVLTAIIREAQLPADYISNLDSGARVPAGAAYRMDENLTVFEDVTGGCERILKTPIPIWWTRHTSRFLMIWLTLLPFALWDTCQLAMLPVVAIIAFLLLGIEEIGVQIEEPFSILPLEGICGTIERNLRELHRMHGARAAAQAAATVQCNGNPNAMPAAALLYNSILQRQHYHQHHQPQQQPFQHHHHQQHHRQQQQSTMVPNSNGVAQDMKHKLRGSGQ